MKVIKKIIQPLIAGMEVFFLAFAAQYIMGVVTLLVKGLDLDFLLLFWVVASEWKIPALAGFGATVVLYIAIFKEKNE